MYPEQQAAQTVALGPMPLPRTNAADSTRASTLAAGAILIELRSLLNRTQVEIGSYCVIGMTITFRLCSRLPTPDPRS